MSLPKKIVPMTEKVWHSYKLRLAMMITDVDIKRWLGDNDDMILRYCQLANYNTIDEVVPHDGSFKFILTEDRANQGHWCVLVRYNDTIEWFDPIGMRPDGELSFIPRAIKLCLGQDKHHLSSLLKRTTWLKLIWNKMKLQKVKPGINTCGKWCIARVVFMKMGYNLKMFQDLIQSEVEETGKPSDVLVVDWIK